MCGGSPPKAPPPPLPPPVQAAKDPSFAPMKRRNKPGQYGAGAPMNGTLLTGSTGVPTSGLNLGGSTLLGGGTLNNGAR